MNRNSQRDTILKAMIEKSKKEWWNAKDFQNGRYFVGYEATARMSELLDLPFIKVRRVDRFREIALDWTYKDDILATYDIIKMKEENK